ncbi:unnamed protein product [Miscanthus lutarioriparius]|uniref:Uncharacterized protein n=1 Tax=Miscanthus lutarioriparius TaxID=422564 RepID=A0A811N8R9_9POAL|nr:unnamed protein product [Miscanthus lutarioriparius]
MQGLFVQTSEVSEVDNIKLARTSISFIDLKVRSVPLDIYPSFSFLMEMTGIEAFILDSCNGLILFGHRQEPFDPLYYTVCNLTTKQWSVVAACGSGEPVSHTYLAFAPAISSHFHLVQFQIRDLYEEFVSLHAYSSETRTWSQNQIDEQKEQGQLKGWHHQFTLDIETDNHLWAFVNGFLHVIVSCSDLQHILVVDVQGKARRLITVPAVSLRHSRGVQTHYLLRLSPKFAFAYCGRVAAAHCVSPMLIDLRIFKCFFERQPVVDITIDWADRYDPSSVQLGELAQLRILSTLCFADALPECQYNWGIVMLLRRFWKIPALFITIITKCEYTVYILL